VPRPESLLSENLPASIMKVPGVAGITSAELAQGMVIKEGVGGVVIEGIDRDTTSKVTPWEEIWVAPPREDLEKKNPYWIWLGVQLAQKLGVKEGDTVDLMIAEGESRRVIPFVVTALTKFGIYDHDLRYVRVDLRVLNEIFRRHHLEPLHKLKIDPGYTVDAVAADLKAELGVNRVNVKKWSEVHQNVFLAVNHQKRLLFLILQIVVALAAMNVVNLLMMSTHQRRRDIAILRAMGLRFSQVIQFFVIQGAVVGMVGVLAGIGLGLATVAAISHFQPALLSEAVYHVTRLPMRVRPVDVGLIAASGFGLCVIFSFIPALGAAISRPVGTLRYE
ncbi:FtsX-like permease family protein, partial [bacterium]|nr:FtsX-like permease family protein [bacterium]